MSVFWSFVVAPNKFVKRRYGQKTASTGHPKRASHSAAVYKGVEAVEKPQ